MEEENVFWAGVWPIGNTEKKVWADYEQLFVAVFSCFQGRKEYLKSFLKDCSNCSVHTKKLHNCSIRWIVEILKN